MCFCIISVQVLHCMFWFGHRTVFLITHYVCVVVVVELLRLKSDEETRCIQEKVVFVTTVDSSIGFKIT